jgi:hypothetical protein
MLEVFSDRQEVELSRPSLKEMVDLSVPKNLTSKGSQRREAAVRLMNRSWFSRAWVCQERVVASDIQVVLRSIQVPVLQFVSLAASLSCREYNVGGYKHSLVKNTSGYAALSLTSVERDRFQKREPRKHNFLGILVYVTQHFKSTDPRDLVYSFLSFQDEGDSVSILPRYDLSLEAAYTNVARTILENSGDLDLFGIVFGDMPRENGGYLPSWVPDWTIARPYSLPIACADIKSSFRACRDFTYQPATDTDPLKLTVQGVVIGSVAAIIPHSFDGGYLYGRCTKHSQSESSPRVD